VREVRGGEYDNVLSFYSLLQLFRNLFCRLVVLSGHGDGYYLCLLAEILDEGYLDLDGVLISMCHGVVDHHAIQTVHDIMIYLYLSQRRLEVLRGHRHGSAQRMMVRADDDERLRETILRQCRIGEHGHWPRVHIACMGDHRAHNAPLALPVKLWYLPVRGLEKIANLYQCLLLRLWIELSRYGRGSHSACVLDNHDYFLMLNIVTVQTNGFYCVGNKNVNSSSPKGARMGGLEGGFKVVHGELELLIGLDYALLLKDLPCQEPVDAGKSPATFVVRWDH